jgi:ligand-binding sensor domain-containing protein
MVWDLEPAGDRTLVGTLNGISVVDGERNVVADAPEARSSRFLRVRDVRSLHRGDGALYVATFGGGVYRLDDGRDRPSRLRHRDGHIRARSVAGAEGTVLVGHSGGLARAEGNRRLTSLSTGGLPSADVTAVTRAFGAMWIGTFDGGLARYDGRRVEAQSRAAERFHVDGRINDLAVTGRGRSERLWIATDRGLFFHDGRRFTPVEDDSAPGRVHVTSLDVARDGALWVTSSRLLSRYRRGQWRSWSGDPTFPVVHLHAVTTDRHGRVWVGSLHGLYQFDEASGTFARHTTASGALPVDWVTAVEPWRDGVVIGTYHGGLSWSDGSSFDVERVSRGGLPAGWVNPHAMRWIGSRLFVGTLERGLLVGSRGRWTQLTAADGLPSADVTDVIPDGNGAAWVATRGGLARIVWN